MLSVHIKLSDKGWILEQCARQLAERLDYVTYDLEENPLATIQYYMTYGARKDRVSKLEVAFLTHLEEHADARELFFQTAHSVDLNVCMSKRYHALLEAKGFTNSVVIKPGVDLAEFSPKLRIGVVGRTYHTQRKGEHIVADVLNIPEIEWYFTSSGWPRPGLELAPGEMPEFYRNMDYILVPSLYEGGPMSAIEALACGTPIIAPDVGWIPDYPHIPFATGSSTDLRRVLTNLVAAKVAARLPVLGQTWDRFANEHDTAFRKLIADKFPGEIVAPKKARAKLASQPYDLSKIALILHQAESYFAGGPSTRVPELAKTLREQGLDARMATPDDVGRSEIAHVFNVWEPAEAIATLRSLRTRGARILFSPIFIDLSARHLWNQKLIAIFENAMDPVPPDAELLSFKDEYESFLKIPFSERPEPVSGFYDQVRVMLGLADHIAFLSEEEKANLEVIAGKPVNGSLVRNAAIPSAAGQVDSSLFRSTFPAVPEQFVLCIGRIETRKNQLMLAVAARQHGLPLVLAGDIADEKYADLIRKFGGPDVHFLGRVSNESGLLPSVLSAASVVALPSWAEGTPLSGLEALAAGKNVILSNQPNLREHFGDAVGYCDPHDINEIGQKIADAFGRHRQSSREAAGIPAWSDHVRDTLHAYSDCITKPRSMSGRFPIDAALVDSLLLDERLKREAAELQAWQIDQHAGVLALQTQEQEATIAGLKQDISDAVAHNELLGRQNAAMEEQIAILNAEYSSERTVLRSEIGRLADLNEKTLASFSWRITAPLRGLNTIVQRCRRLLGS